MCCLKTKLKPHKQAVLLGKLVVNSWAGLLLTVSVEVTYDDITVKSSVVHSKHEQTVHGVNMHFHSGLKTTRVINLIVRLTCLYFWQNLSVGSLLI